MSNLAERSEEKVRAERKAYVTPQLSEYGHVEKLTRTGTGSQSDGHAMKVGA